MLLLFHSSSSSFLVLSPFLLLLFIISFPSRITPHPLVPLPSGIILHGGGSGDTDFQPYAAFLQTNAPSFYMTYLGIDSLNSTLPNQINPWFTTLNTTLLSYANDNVTGYDYYLLPQIGLALPQKDRLELIANGSFDNALKAFVVGMEALNRPAYVRIGYENNGPWNSYPSQAYKDSYKRIVQFIRNSTLLSRTIANVWDITCDEPNNYADWYPGDAIVDWWGVNVYSHDSAPQAKCVTDFLDKARSSKFPVLFGEVSPRGYYTNKSSTWNDWFQPYFSLLSEYKDVVRASSYINRNWEAHSNYKGWGDSRIETSGANISGVQGNYVEYISNQHSSKDGVVWFNRNNFTTVMQTLGLIN